MQRLSVCVCAYVLCVCVSHIPWLITDKLVQVRVCSAFKSTFYLYISQRTPKFCSRGSKVTELVLEDGAKRGMSVTRRKMNSPIHAFKETLALCSHSLTLVHAFVFVCYLSLSLLTFFPVFFHFSFYFQSFSL